MLFLRDFNIGDHIYIFVDAAGVMKPAESESGDGTNACHIIDMTYDDVIVGWKLGELPPRPNYSVRITLAENEGNCYPGFFAWASLSRVRRTPGLVLLDGPCRQCSKKNSSSDKKCWWCCVSYPTDLKRTGP